MTDSSRKDYLQGRFSVLAVGIPHKLFLPSKEVFREVIPNVFVCTPRSYSTTAFMLDEGSTLNNWDGFVINLFAPPELTPNEEKPANFPAGLILASQVRRVHGRSVPLVITSSRALGRKWDWVRRLLDEMELSYSLTMDWRWIASSIKSQRQ